ncbi:hypothetical protein PQX77_012567 [Marasmius sp. AFHP31]|nr:hypothetical protein PQX77_012567 [Marasmius sp. AFHP31]
MQYVPGQGSHHTNNRLRQNINHGRDQNFNDRGYQTINNGGQIGQSAGRDINHFYTTGANFGRERLSNAIAGVGASHNAEHQFERGQCLPGTREKAIESIYDWVSSNDQTCPVCWLSGPAGVGKSAIALTVAKSYEIEGRLASSFFFFRSDSKRNNPSALIPFIAHDLTSVTPLMQNCIDQRISKDPKILDATLEDQFNELVLQPALMWGEQRFLRGSSTDLSGSPVVPNIVIIDGLDECSDEDTQLRILSIIQSAYQQAPHFPLRFLICSRPESWIQEAFADDPLFQLSKRIVLDDSLAGREDTRTYYLHHFDEIVTCRRYRHIQFPSPWPSKRDLEILVEWACSQFVFAVTVIKFITDAGRHPIEQLRIIIEKIPLRRLRTSPYQQLDTLYEVILNANPDPEEVHDILAALLVLEGHLKTNSAHIESNQLYGPTTRDFFTKWIDFCVSTPKPTRDLLEHLWNVDLASTHLVSGSLKEWNWNDVFKRLVPWVQRYNVPRISGNMDKKEAGGCVQNVKANGQCESEGYSSKMGKERDGADLVEGLVLKLQTRPRCFHLEIPPGQSRQDNLIFWFVRNAIGCSRYRYTPPALNGIPPHGVDNVLLTDCHCDLSGGSEAHDPGHLAYQDSCMQFAKANISYFTGLGQGIGDFSEVGEVFERIVGSSLLKHCRVHTELLSLCQTFFEHAKGLSTMSVRSYKGEEYMNNMLEWIEVSKFAGTLIVALRLLATYRN